MVAIWIFELPFCQNYHILLFNFDSSTHNSAIIVIWLVLRLAAAFHSPSSNPTTMSGDILASIA